ncbi:MAG: HU family DNA-binding protein [Oligoflexus sp.]
MNRAELVEALAKETGHSKAECDRWVGAFIGTVEKNMKKKEGIKLVGFGTFDTSQRKARKGRNPQTGHVIKIPAKTVPVFRPGTQLKQLVDRGR